MATVTGPKKGTTTPLTLAGGSSGRLLAGLSWTPKLEKKRVKYSIPPLKDEEGRYDTFYFFKLPFLLAYQTVRVVVGAITPSLPKKGETTDPHDLDLYCYIFDADFKLVQSVGPKDADVIDSSGKIYHSGEDQVGREAKDAEQIFVETREIPGSYQHLFFVVRSANRHQMGDIPDGSVRLSDSAANMNILQTQITAKAMPPGNSYGYVLCRLSRDGDGWTLRNFDSFVGKEVDWSLLLPSADL
jgi:stress response protein SCP2